MTKMLGFYTFAACAGSVLAQPASIRPTPIDTTSQTVKYLAGEPNATSPPILNILTVIGDNFPGVPCLDCLLDILEPTLGLPVPADQAFRGANYQIDTFLIDNSYTGSCTFTFEVKDSQKEIIVSTSQTLMENAGTEILLSTPVTIPTTASLGVGSVSTTAVCGSSMSQSSSPIFVACVTNPPYCVN
jgi:hypothetical protein